MCFRMSDGTRPFLRDMHQEVEVLTIARGIESPSVDGTFNAFKLALRRFQIIGPPGSRPKH